MHRKHNPYVALVAFLLLAVILAHVCTGCAVQAEETAPRFTVEKAGNGCRIITDNQTGVRYLYYAMNSYGGGLTKLEG